MAAADPKASAADPDADAGAAVAADADAVVAKVGRAEAARPATHRAASDVIATADPVAAWLRRVDPPGHAR
jgi:hypothetical protein